MSDLEFEQPDKPRPWVRWLVSLLVCLHFFAILTAVTSSGSGQFEAPYVAVKLNEPFRPYLDTLFLRNGYRFFAPNPGPNFVTWFRMTYEDGRVRWHEFPLRKNYATRLAYTRMLSMSNMGSQLEDHPADPSKAMIAPGTQICLSSFARHIASENLVKKGLREKGSIQSIEIYRVSHLYIMPDQIRQGWDYTDLRLYQPIYLGTYRPDGSQIDKKAVRYCQMPILVTDMIKNDIAPVLLANSQKGTEDYAAKLETLGIPESICQLIHNHPEIVSLSTAEITEHVRTALGIADKLNSRQEANSKASQRVER